jgi:hypothetical protein
MKALGFETEPPQKVVSAWLGKTGARLALFTGCSEHPGSDVSLEYSTSRRH